MAAADGALSENLGNQQIWDGVTDHIVKQRPLSRISVCSSNAQATKSPYHRCRSCSKSIYHPLFFNTVREIFFVSIREIKHKGGRLHDEC